MRRFSSWSTEKRVLASRFATGSTEKFIFKQGIAAVGLISASLAYADDFATGEVWGLIWDNVGCMPTPNGVQGGTWNERFVALSREQVFEGNGLKLTASFTNGRTLTQYWFRNKSTCENAKQSGTRTGVVSHAMQNDHDSEKSSLAPAITNEHKRIWYAQDLNHRHCIASLSPADQIRDEQHAGHHVETKDLPGRAVEVDSYAQDGDHYTAWTFYRDGEACINSLPGSQSIRSDYE
ncbi:hypothetical protein [Pseudomonas sp. MWU13-2105]|uniref:hypothetical protein n=1 Tax=Pseudomonas sp. MWU13-2105 TaxID=2935074 RepID=UPI00200CCDEE|nr:hypothetical protein [Pseudomonas sp. MWU13-2105]